MFTACAGKLLGRIACIMLRGAVTQQWPGEGNQAKTAVAEEK